MKQAATQATKTYAVVSGDYLSRIADEQKVRGGWQKLYDDNRSVVGDDPSMIHPGLKLTIGAKSMRRWLAGPGQGRGTGQVLQRIHR